MSLPVPDDAGGPTAAKDTKFTNRKRSRQDCHEKHKKARRKRAVGFLCLLVFFVALSQPVPDDADGTIAAKDTKFTNRKRSRQDCHEKHKKARRKRAVGFLCLLVFFVALSQPAPDDADGTTAAKNAKLTNRKGSREDCHEKHKKARRKRAVGFLCLLVFFVALSQPAPDDADGTTAAKDKKFTNRNRSRQGCHEKHKKARRKRAIVFFVPSRVFRGSISTST